MLTGVNGASGIENAQQSIDFSRIDMGQLACDAIADVLPDGSELDQYLPPHNMPPSWFRRGENGDYATDHDGPQHPSMRYHELLPPASIKLESPNCVPGGRSYNYHALNLTDYYNAGATNGWPTTSNPSSQLVGTLPSYQYLQRAGGAIDTPPSPWPNFV
jgi:hypothetical protein